MPVVGSSRYTICQPGMAAAVSQTAVAQPLAECSLRVAGRLYATFNYSYWSASSSIVAHSVRSKSLRKQSPRQGVEHFGVTWGMLDRWGMKVSSNQRASKGGRVVHHLSWQVRGEAEG